MNKAPIGLVSCVAPWFDVPSAARNLAATRDLLARDFEVVGPVEPLVLADGVDEATDQMRAAGVVAVVIQPGTFPDGNAPVTVAERVAVPVIVHSLPEPHLDGTVPLNSLCGANLITFTLSELGLPHTHVHADPTNAAASARLLAHAAAARAVAQLRRTTLYIVGSRVPGFFPCIFDEIVARKTLGVTAEYIGLQELTERLATGKRRPAPASPRTIDGGELDEAGIEVNEQHYEALASLLEAHDADVVAIRDWPELYVDGQSGGIWPAIGWLQDEGRVIGVEGDANAALTMAMQRAIAPAAGAPFLTDIVKFDPERSTLTLWHYGGPPSLADDPGAVCYTEDGKEVEYTLRPGTATLVRIGLHHGRLRLLSIVVEVLDERVHLRRAAGIARTTASGAEDVVRELLDGGWEHHVCLGYGEITEELTAFARFVGLEHVRL